MKNLDAMVQRIRDEAGDSILALAKLRLNYESRMALLAASLKESKAGTQTYVNTLRVMGEEERRQLELEQSLGLLPKSLGVAVTERFDFKATVGLSQDSGRRTTMFVDAEPVEQKQLR